MKRSICLLLALGLALLLCACGRAPVPTGTAEPGQSLTPTGYPSGEYQHIYLLYNGVMYTYDTSGTGRWEAGEAQAEAIGLEKVAEVELVDNYNPPTEELQATRLTVGDPIYAKEGEDCVYVLLESGTLWRLNPCSAADDPRNG